MRVLALEMEQVTWKSGSLDFIVTLKENAVNYITESVDVRPIRLYLDRILTESIGWRDWVTKLDKRTQAAMSNDGLALWIESVEITDVDVIGVVISSIKIRIVESTLLRYESGNPVIVQSSTDGTYYIPRIPGIFVIGSCRRCSYLFIVLTDRDTKWVALISTPRISIAEASSYELPSVDVDTMFTLRVTLGSSDINRQLLASGLDISGTSSRPVRLSRSLSSAPEVTNDEVTIYLLERDIDPGTIELLLGARSSGEYVVPMLLDHLTRHVTDVKILAAYALYKSMI